MLHGRCVLCIPCAEHVFGRACSPTVAAAQRLSACTVAEAVGVGRQALQASEGEVEELRGHVIICGFGRVGQTIGQLLAERLIPFVAVDVRVDRVQVRDLWIFGPCSQPCLSRSSDAMVMLLALHHHRHRL